jgi:hypothetical protein
MVLKFTPDRTDRPWSTVGSHAYRDGFVSVTVPDGFRTDLASIPTALAWLYCPNGRHQVGALFHDYLYATKIMSRFQSDAIFRVIMADSGVIGWRRISIYYAVRAFGWIAWRSRRNCK